MQVENEPHREFSESDSEPLGAALFRKAINVKAVQKTLIQRSLGPEESSIL